MPSARAPRGRRVVPGVQAHLQSAWELDLTTRGRVSGQPRTVELWFVYQEGCIYFLAGRSVSGVPSHWYRNLQAHPEATISLGGVSVPVRLQQVKDVEFHKARVMSLFRKKYGPATMRRWYHEGGHVPLRCEVLG